MRLDLLIIAFTAGFYHWSSFANEGSHPSGNAEQTTAPIEFYIDDNNEVIEKKEFYSQNSQQAGSTPLPSEVVDPMKMSVPEMPARALELGCFSIYQYWIKHEALNNPKVKYKNMERYFILGSLSYRKDRADEFVWREKEAAYKNEFDKYLTEDRSYIYNVSANLLPYDFAKKGFYVEFNISKGGDILFPGSEDIEHKNFCGYWPDSQWKDVPSAVRIYAVNPQKRIFLKMSEEEARKISSKRSLSNRAIEVALIVTPKKIHKSQKHHNQLGHGVRRLHFEVGVEVLKFQLKQFSEEFFDYKN